MGEYNFFFIILISYKKILIYYFSFERSSEQKSKGGHVNDFFDLACDHEVVGL